MAQYRLEASIIKRSEGRSVTAAAAYRAACEIECDRYGEHHDYTRKQGVLHSEIITPDNTPEWMKDRAALWNAVEAAESRKNAQLAREILFSLPHELTDDQRRDLLCSFVSEQCVKRGMIADVNIHAPHRTGDDRNYHGHVLLTMRELTGEGFHAKKSTPLARSWNKDELLCEWREAWADHQNQVFERLDLSVRVDHRSYEAQGIDREPGQHMGPHASAMERRGKETRIGKKNRATEDRNAERTRQAAQLAKIEAELSRERDRFADWKNKAKDQLWERQFEERQSLSNRHHQKKQSLERELKGTYGERMKNMREQAKETKKRLKTKGIRGFVRKITGQKNKDEQALRNLKRSHDSAKQRVQESREALQRKQEKEKQALEQKHQQRTADQQTRLDAAEQRKERELKARFKEKAQNLRTKPGPAAPPKKKPPPPRKGPGKGIDI